MEHQPHEMEKDERMLLASAQTCMASLLHEIEDLSVWVKDASHFYRFVNRGFLLNYGVDRPEDVLGKTDFELNEESERLKNPGTAVKVH